MRQDAATLSLSCDRAGTAGHGTPTPREQLDISVVTPSGISAAASASTGQCSGGSFCDLGPMETGDPVTGTITLPSDAGAVWGIQVTTTNGDGWTWQGLGNRGRLPDAAN